MPAAVMLHPDRQANLDLPRTYPSPWLVSQDEARKGCGCPASRSAAQRAAVLVTPPTRPQHGDCP
jgi:hypothetical protein